MLTPKPWKIESLLQLLLGIFGSITFSGLLIMGFGHLNEPSGVDYFSMLVGAISVHGVGLLWLNWFILDHQMTWRDLICSRWVMVPVLALVGVLCGVIGFYACMYLGELQGRVFSYFSVEAEPQSTVVALQSSVSLPWIVFFGVVSIVLAPIVEEILFRGILYPMVKQMGHPRAAVWGTSLFFAASHANLNAFVPLTLLALGFVWLYERTGQLLAPIVAHSTFNAINFSLTIHYGAFSANT